MKALPTGSAAAAVTQSVGPPVQKAGDPPHTDHQSVLHLWRSRVGMEGGQGQGGGQLGLLGAYRKRMGRDIGGNYQYPMLLPDLAKLPWVHSDLCQPEKTMA